MATARRLWRNPQGYYPCGIGKLVEGRYPIIRPILPHGGFGRALVPDSGTTEARCGLPQRTGMMWPCEREQIRRAGMRRRLERGS
jgi:hypothetical protein